MEDGAMGCGIVERVGKEGEVVYVPATVGYCIDVGWKYCTEVAVPGTEAREGWGTGATAGLGT